MKYTLNTIIWTADDEEPDCEVCDNQDCYGRCEHCGAEFGKLLKPRRVTLESSIL